MDTHDYLFKMLLIGNSGVGKSCLLVRYAVSILKNIERIVQIQVLTEYFHLILGKLIQRQLFQYNWSRFQNKNNRNGWAEYQVADLGHCGSGTI